MANPMTCTLTYGSTTETRIISFAADRSTATLDFDLDATGNPSLNCTATATFTVSPL